MNRRAFLSSLAAMSIAPGFDPERLFWKPRAMVVKPAPVVPMLSSTDDFYTGMGMMFTDGSGALRIEKIVSYCGATKVATINTSADSIRLDDAITIIGLPLTPRLPRPTNSSSS